MYQFENLINKIYKREVYFRNIELDLFVYLRADKIKAKTMYQERLKVMEGLVKRSSGSLP